MGGGLRKPSPATSYSASDGASPVNGSKATVSTDAGMGRSINGARVLAHERDEDDELDAKREEEMAQRQRTAVDHVVEHLFPYAPVRVQTQKYPPSSPNAGKSYLWVSVDENEIKRRGGAASPVRYPVGVAIDAEGNVFVSEGNSTPISLSANLGIESPQARKISAASIVGLASNKIVPPPPKAPKLIHSTQTSLTVRWKKSPDTTVDRYEVQYHIANSPNSTWANLITVLTVRDVTLDELRCHSCYEFRVRAHNPVGWSDYSSNSDVLWTMPGIPDLPHPPIAGALANSYVSLFWPRVGDNGASPVTYRLEVRECIDGGNRIPGSVCAQPRSQSLELLYEGNECSFVASGLKSLTRYMFRVQAYNSVGFTKFVESRPIRTLAHPKPEVVELSSAEQAAAHDRWVQCWDPKSENVFFFNRYTCQRVAEEPSEVCAAREIAGLGNADESPEMIFRRKRFRFHRELRQGLPPDATLSGSLPIALTRETMYADTFKCFQGYTKQALVGKPKVTFENEDGIDSGGLTKDWYLQISKLAVKQERCLFKECDNGHFELACNSARNPAHLKEFKFLGKFMAKAIFDRQSLDFPLCDAVLKHFLQLPRVLDDLKQIDSQYHKSLLWMLENEIANVIDETFSVELEGDLATGSKMPKIRVEDLKENGRDIPVTDANKEEYVQLMLMWRTEFGVKAQLENFVQGFTTLIPLQALKVFTVAELRMLVNGKPSIDVEELRANAIFQGGYGEHTQVVLWLWQALREFSLELRGLFLKFMTGTSKIPLDGFEPPLNITKSDLDPQALPRSHTCFNQLVLPEYETYQTLIEKITYAISNAEGFQLS